MKLSKNILVNFWEDEKTKEIHLTSIGNDTGQRWWKERDDRKFIITEQIIKNYNKSFGKYTGIITSKNKAFVYRCQILIKPTI